MGRSIFLLAALVAAFCLGGPAFAADPEPPAGSEIRPFVEGTTWSFKSGFYNDMAARVIFGRSLPDIVKFDDNVGREAGLLTLSVTRPREDLLVLSEVYEYPESGAGSTATEEVRAAVPPRARIAEIRETTSEDMAMTTLVTNRGGATDEFLHLLPVRPTAGLEWHWNTTASDFHVGPVPEEDQASYNASGTVVSLAASPRNYATTVDGCVHVRLVVDGITTDWWFHPTTGLVRFGGDNLGLAREALEIPNRTGPGGTTPATGPDPLPLDRLVYMRL